MITFKDYVQNKQLMEFDASTDFMGGATDPGGPLGGDSPQKVPSSDSGKWKFSRGDGSNSSEQADKALAQLNNLVRMVIEHSPPTVLSFLTRVKGQMNDTFNQQLQDMQNSGAWAQIQGMRKPRIANNHPSDDGLETIAPNDADSGGGAGGEEGGE